MDTLPKEIHNEIFNESFAAIIRNKDFAAINTFARLCKMSSGIVEKRFNEIKAAFLITYTYCGTDAEDGDRFCKVYSGLPNLKKHGRNKYTSDSMGFSSDHYERYEEYFRGRLLWSVSINRYKAFCSVEYVNLTNLSNKTTHSYVLNGGYISNYTKRWLDCETLYILREKSRVIIKEGKSERTVTGAACEKMKADVAAELKKIMALIED